MTLIAPLMIKKKKEGERNPLLLHCSSSASPILLRELQRFYLTVPIVWFLMEHHASNTSLKDTTKVSNALILPGGEEKARVSPHTPAVCDHTLVAAVFFVPFFALDGRVVAARSHADAHHRGGVAGAVHLHLHLENERRVTLLQGSTWTPVII